MATTIFSNVKSVSVNGVTITEVTSLDYTISGSADTLTVDGGAYASIGRRGVNTISFTVNSQAPNDTFTAATTAPSANDTTFVMTAGDDGSGTSTATFKLTNATEGERAIGTEWSWDTGGPGEGGTFSAPFEVYGLTNANLDANYKNDFVTLT